jgi:hypothetical protein
VEQLGVFMRKESRVWSRLIRLERNIAGKKPHPLKTAKGRTPSLLWAAMK